MNSYKSPEEINSYADEIHMLQLKLDKMSTQLIHNLDIVGSIGVRHDLQESFTAAYEITDHVLQHKLSSLLKDLEHELRDQAQRSAEMREVYAPPEFIQNRESSTGSLQKSDIGYPMNYQSYSQNDESVPRELAHETKTTNVESDWKNGDTLTSCARCHNSIPWTIAQCPFCGLVLRKEKNGEQAVCNDKRTSDTGEAVINAVYASPDPFISEGLNNKSVADIQEVYASPGVMRMRGPFRAVLSSLWGKISKKGK